MNAQQNAPISDRFSSLCARVFSPAAAILESEKTLGTRLSASWPGYEAGFNRRFGNAAFFSSHKFKHLRVSGKTNLPKCSGFFMNEKPWSL